MAVCPECGEGLSYYPGDDGYCAEVYCTICDWVVTGPYPRTAWWQQLEQAYENALREMCANLPAYPQELEGCLKEPS